MNESEKTIKFLNEEIIDLKERLERTDRENKNLYIDMKAEKIINEFLYNLLYNFVTKKGEQ